MVNTYVKVVSSSTTLNKVIIESTNINLSLMLLFASHSFIICLAWRLWRSSAILWSIILLSLFMIALEVSVWKILYLWDRLLLLVVSLFLLFPFCLPSSWSCLSWSVHYVYHIHLSFCWHFLFVYYHQYIWNLLFSLLLMLLYLESFIVKTIMNVVFLLFNLNIGLWTCF